MNHFKSGTICVLILSETTHMVLKKNRSLIENLVYLQRHSWKVYMDWRVLFSVIVYIGRSTCKEKVIFIITTYYFCLLFERIICIRKRFPFYNLGFWAFLCKLLSLKVSIAGTSLGVCSLIGRGVKKVRSEHFLALFSLLGHGTKPVITTSGKQEEVIRNFYRAVWKVFSVKTFYFIKLVEWSFQIMKHVLLV